MRSQTEPPPLDRQIAGLAKRQWGVVGRTQLLAAGADAAAIDRRVASGRLHRIHRGVYAVGHPVVSIEGQWMAAVLACGPGAVLSHRDAAHLFGMRAGSRSVIDVTTPRRTGRAGPLGIDLHRTRHLLPEDVTTHRGVPTTTPARTITDLADILTPRALQRVIDEAEIRRLHAPIAPKNGRRGTPSLAALKDHHAGSTRTRNQLEEAFLAICDRAGLPRPRVNHPVEGYEGDFVWPQHNLIVETDGYATHHTRSAFENDRRRDTELQIAGWRVTRFSYLQVTHDPQTVTQQLQALITPTPRPARPLRPRAAARPR